MKTRCIVTILMTSMALLLILTVVPKAFAYYIEYWEDDVTKKTFVPVFVLYRPPGTNSYQQVTAGVNLGALTLKFKSGSPPFSVASGVSTTVPVDFSSGLKTPSSDGVFGKKLTLYWHIWGYTRITMTGWYDRITSAELRGLSDDGWAFVGRADLPSFQYHVYYVPNLRGTVGAWHYPSSGTVTLGPGTEWTHYFSHSWPKTDNIDLNAKISIEYMTATASCGYYWQTSGGTGNFGYETCTYINDPSIYLSFTINADAGVWGDPITTINDYIFWFNEY